VRRPRRPAVLRDRARVRQAAGAVARGRGELGRCPICAGPTVFVRADAWLRDFYFCGRCWSIPRQRALVHVLEALVPHWRALRIHEFAPSGPASEKLAREAPDYTGSHFWPNVPLGAERDGWRCEDLERLTLPDESLELVVTQDVFEHVLGPERAFAEIGRVLRPGGAHVFTVPWYAPTPTRVRARGPLEAIRHLAPPEYHGDPVDTGGALVATEWGPELLDVIREASGMTTTIHRPRDRRRGLEAEFLEVFVSRKPAPHG
jgi:SAM-dependent methyltransferase